jgi:hypothetical protein
VFILFAALEKALVYVEKKELPQGWLKDVLLGRQHEQVL